MLWERVYRRYVQVAAQFRSQLDAGNAGTVTVIPNSPAWLPTHSANATFSATKPGPVIFKRGSF